MSRENALSQLWGRLKVLLKRGARFGIDSLKHDRGGKSLRVSETIQLGDKRFVSVLEVDGRRILLGGSPTQVTLLCDLAGDREKSLQRSTFEHAIAHAGMSSRELAIMHETAARS